MAVTKRSIARDAVAVATGLHLADLAAVRGVRAARRQFVRDDIARRLGVTPRYVHLLLEDAGWSFSEHVLDHRLAHARRLLRDPQRRAMKVADVAFACGFSDLSYFNRTYRARFGEAPSQTRAS